MNRGHAQNIFFESAWFSTKMWMNKIDIIQQIEQISWSYWNMQKLLWLYLKKSSELKVSTSYVAWFWIKYYLKCVLIWYSANIFWESTNFKIFSANLVRRFGYFFHVCPETQDKNSSLSASSIIDFDYINHPTEILTFKFSTQIFDNIRDSWAQMSS